MIIFNSSRKKANILQQLQLSPDSVNELQIN